MERKLTDENEAKLSMYMRVLEFLRKNENVFKQKPEFVNEYEKLKVLIPQILNQLDEEELNIVLERYKEEIEFLKQGK
jgi:hypothetical protein